MARERTASAIRKSKRTDEQKAEVRRHSAQYASKMYRQRNKAKVNAQAKERADRKKSSMSEVEKAAFNASRKEAAQRYYLKAHVQKHGGADWAWFTYNCRQGKKRVGVEEAVEN
ncbi:hypothetical protein FB446DRAFT_708780 [Lentinula raphanica]|nr:hypothetical protein FB446DRAFT_708780 [Lentinula raphanica]